MRRNLFIFLAVFFLILVSCPFWARAANELPYLSIHSNSGVPQITKRYFYESNGQKETIVIAPQYKDISDNEPIKAITKGENYAKIIAHPYLKNKSLIHMEYVKEGLIFFDPQNIIFKDKQGKNTYLPYPAGITPGPATSPWEKGFLSVSDGEKVYFLVRNLAKLYLFDPRVKKIIFLAPLKEFKNDSLPFFSAAQYPGGYSLVSLSESFGEPHLGSAGHCLLFKNNQLKGYWRNESYGGGNTLPAWAEKNILVAAQKEQMAVYSLPSFTCTKEITLDFKNPGVVMASSDYVVLRDNEQNVLHLFDIRTGEGQTPFETIFSEEEKASLNKKKKESWFTYPDFTDCLAINGDNFTFVRHEEDPLELILNDNHYGYGGFCYKTYRYSYNFKTRQYTKKEAVPGDYANITSRQKLVNDKGLDLSIIENGETLSVYANDKVVSTFDYPRRFLGTYVKDNAYVVTYYLENILENGPKTSVLTSFTFALPSRYVPNEKKNLISLSPNTYPFILQEAIAAVPFNKNLYLITKNKLFKVSNGKILKMIPLANITDYAIGKNTLYLYSKDKAWTINHQDKIRYLGPTGLGATDLAKVLLDSKFINPGNKIKIIEEKTKDKVLKASVYHLGLACSQDCYYVEAEHSAGKKSYYLLFAGSLLELPGTLKGKKYFIYETTEKIYSTPIRKLHKLIIITPKEKWEYWYKITVLKK
ncbi:MAG: hypothetical protein STSR0004_10580 [Peptococcaceae bacterium]